MLLYVRIKKKKVSTLWEDKQHSEEIQEKLQQEGVIMSQN